MPLPKKKKILVLIPARGGSKGLPGKNIKRFSSKPLIAWTIEAAKKSKQVSRVIVATDAKDIARVSQKYGAQIVSLPKNLTTDTSPVSGAVLYALDWLEKQGEVFDLLVMLQPTSPLRDAKNIDQAITTFTKDHGDSLVSVSESDHPPYWMFKIERHLKPLFSPKYLKTRKQDLPKVYRPNGAIYILSVKSFYRYKKFYIGKVTPYVMPAERSVDIDTLTDFLFAETLFKQIKK